MDNVLEMSNNGIAKYNDHKKYLEDFLNEIFSANETEELPDENANPEVRFTKFLWKIKFIEKELQKHSQVAKDTIKDIETWYEKKRNQLLGQINFLTNQMENYLRGNNLKSLSLPSGRIGFRKQQDKVEIVNPDLFYSKASSEVLRHIPESYEPDMVKIKSQLKENGVIPDGVEVTHQQPKFYYKLNG